jgi:hypothetical protein
MLGFHVDIAMHTIMYMSEAHVDMSSPVMHMTQGSSLVIKMSQSPTVLFANSRAQLTHLHRCKKDKSEIGYDGTKLYSRC